MLRPHTYHGGDLAVSLQVLYDLALVDRFNAGKQSSLADCVRLVCRAQVVKLSASEGEPLGALGVREDTDTAADRFSRRLDTHNNRLIQDTQEDMKTLLQHIYGLK